MNKIEIGQNYIFTKSGSEVKVEEKSSISQNGKKQKGFVVSRVDSGKRMFVLENSLQKIETR